MKTILQNSVLYRVMVQLIAWYHAGAIAGFFRSFSRAYPYSHFRQWWERFCAAPWCTEFNSRFARWMLACKYRVRDLRVPIENSMVYRAGKWLGERCLALLRGGVVGRALCFLGVRGVLLMALALYLPLDVVIRATMPSFIASTWDELLMLAAFGYVLWRIAMHRSPDGLRVTPVDSYLLLFIAVGFFLMCVVSPYPSIAVAGYRAVVQYLFWFFLVTRLIEDNKDFAIFYGTLLVLAVALALHGIYQYIVAVPIPEAWVSQTEQSVRTRVFSITGSPNIMGSILVLFAPLLAALAYYFDKLWIKVLAICGTGLMCISLIFTFSKGAWLGLIVAVLVFAIFLDRRLIALMGVAAMGALLAVPSITDRITYLFTSDYRTASLRGGRMIRWEKGLSLLRSANEWLGFGLGRFGGAVAMQNQIMEKTSFFEYFYMDNYYLKTLVEMGRIGLFFYLLLLVGLVLWCLRSIGRTENTPTNRTRVLVVALFSGLAGVLTHCYYENIFEVPYMMAYFWSMAAAIFYLAYFRNKNEPLKIAKCG